MNSQNKSKFLTQVRYYPYLPNEMEYCLRREIAQKNSPGCKCLDLMSGCFTYIPEYVKASELIGIGLNQDELLHNKNLTGYIIQDLNKNSILPFNDSYFDIVTMTSGMAYLKNPKTLFQSVAKVLKPGGILFIGFTDRQYDEDTTKLWIRMTPHEKTIYTRKTILSGSDHFDVHHKIFLYDTRNKDKDESARLDLLICVKKAIASEEDSDEQLSLTIDSYDALSASKCLVPLIENRIFNTGNYAIHYNASAFDQSNIALPYMNDYFLSLSMKKAEIFIEILPFVEEIDLHGTMISVLFSESQS